MVGGGELIVCIPAVPGYLHPSVVPAVLQSGFDCVVCNVSEPNSYFHAFVNWWHSYPNGFVVVEHDVEIIPAAVTETQQNVLQEMVCCDSSWCCSPYNDHHLLGCTKFLPRHLKINWTIVRELCGGRWEGLDMAVSKSIRQFGEIPHVHRRGTLHHHNYGFSG